jgi:hypothetical protein
VLGCAVGGVVGVTELRLAAMDYAWSGIPVFPLAPRTKVPAIRSPHPEGDPQRTTCHGECGQLGHGLYDATTDFGQVVDWWIRQPDANIGVPCGPYSGWLAVDLDGDAAEAAWMALEELHGPAPTLASITGRGRHLVYTWPEGCGLGNSKDRLGPHIDARGIGGYICAAPSVHPNGRVYRWDLTGAYTPQEPPRWLLEALEPTAPAPRRAARPGGACVGGGVPAGLPRHLQAQAAEAPAGDRSRQTYRLVCAAAEWGLDDTAIISLAGAHAPSIEKYGDRLPAEVDRILGRVRPDHPHVGHPCDTAGCPRAPRWMGVNA